MIINKYYTPSIEEFHVGFRYLEVWGLENINMEYIPNIFLSKDSVKYLVENIIVKYLDQQDIEELGWKINSDNYYFKPIGIGEHYFLEQIKENIWSITYEDHTGEEEKTEQLFSGMIKNYNELKQVMKFLNII